MFFPLQCFKSLVVDFIHFSISSKDVQCVFVLYYVWMILFPDMFFQLIDVCRGFLSNSDPVESVSICFVFSLPVVYFKIYALKFLP